MIVLASTSHETDPGQGQYVSAAAASSDSRAWEMLLDKATAIGKSRADDL